jgi:hypothetical protein
MRCQWRVMKKKNIFSGSNPCEACEPCKAWVLLGMTLTMDSVNTGLDGSFIKFVNMRPVLHVQVYETNASVKGYSCFALWDQVGGACQGFEPDDGEIGQNQVPRNRNLIRNCPLTPDNAKRELIAYGSDIATKKGKTTHSEATRQAPTFVAKHIIAPVNLQHHNVTLVCQDFSLCRGWFSSIPPSHAILVSDPRTRFPNATRHDPQQVRERNQLVLRAWVQSMWYRCGRQASLRECASCFVPLCWTSRRLSRWWAFWALNFAPSSNIFGCAHTTSCSKGSLDIVWIRSHGSMRSPTTVSPAGIVTGIGTPDYTIMRLKFGSYIQVSEDSYPSNTLRTSFNGAIALAPTENEHNEFVCPSRLATSFRATSARFSPWWTR